MAPVLRQLDLELPFIVEVDQPPLYPWNAVTTDSPAVDEGFRRSKQVWESAHRRLERMAASAKCLADRRQVPEPRFRPGDRVWLATKNIRNA